MLLTRRAVAAMIAGVLAAPVFAPLWQQAARAQQDPGFRKSKLTIVTERGRFDFNIELAETSVQQSRGLMYRQELAHDAGMLFDYQRSRRVSMWMQNTFIPLDMLFIDSDGRVVNIAERAVPRSTSIIPSRGRVRAVLEVNGGTADKLGIKPGDQVLHPIFGNAD